MQHKTSSLNDTIHQWLQFHHSCRGSPCVDTIQKRHFAWFEKCSVAFFDSLALQYNCYSITQTLRLKSGNKKRWLRQYALERNSDFCCIVRSYQSSLKHRVQPDQFWRCPLKPQPNILWTIPLTLDCILTSINAAILLWWPVELCGESTK